MIVELADSLESDDRAKLRNSLDPDYSLVDISDHDYDLDAIHEQVDYLENEAIQEIEAILEDIQSGEGYAKNWLNSLKLTIRTKSEKIKKTLNNIRLGEE
jgi:peptidoglycan hydrolase CwlO-like protein